MSVTQETAKALVRVEQAERMLARLMEMAEATEHELAMARGALRGKKTEAVGLPGKQWAERPANCEPPPVSCERMVLPDGSLVVREMETDLD